MDEMTAMAERARQRVQPIIDTCEWPSVDVDVPAAVGIAMRFESDICVAMFMRGTSNKCIITAGAMRSIAGDELTLLNACNDHNFDDLTARAFLHRNDVHGMDVLVQESLPIKVMEQEPAFAAWLIQTVMSQSLPAMRARLVAADVSGEPYVWGPVTTSPGSRRPRASSSIPSTRPRPWPTSWPPWTTAPPCSSTPAAPPASSPMLPAFA